MKLRKRILCLLASVVFCAGVLTANAASAATVLTENATGVEDGYNYELWKDSGNTTMTLTGNGTFSCEWSDINNCLFRTGKKFDCTQTYKEIGNIVIDYEADYHPNGNSYLCVYGWTREPLVEYYIVESWGSWRPPGADSMGVIEVDGGTYDVYKTTRVNQPSIDGNTTFEQYWSVRQEKRESGTINVAAHFAEWEKLGLPMGKLYETALNVEGYQSSGSATILKNEVTVGGEVPSPGPDTDPAEPDEDGYFFHSTFEKDEDSWTGRGDASVSVTDTTGYLGEKSLAVSGRTDTWNGAARSLSTKTFVPGTAYSFSAMVMQDQTDSEDFRLTLQYDLDGEEKYASVAEATGANGQWVLLENTSFTIPEGATGLLLYVETADSMTDFYLDEAIGAPEGTSVEDPAKTLTGDADGSGKVDVADVVLLTQYLLETETEINGAAADIDGNGILDAFDLAMLRNLLLTAESKPDTPETPDRVEGQWYNISDISHIDTEKPMVAICFDDGPVDTGDDGSAGRILSALSDSGFHSTFFYWGNRINARNESEIIRAQELGNEIANHTWSHPDLTELSAAEIQSEIGKCAEELTRITGLTDFLVRPPYLAVNDTVKEAAGVPLINCAVDSQDWNGASTEQIINTITSKMADGSLDNKVVLMHETYDTTAEAIEYLAPYMKEQGWQIVTVSEMFKANDKIMYNGTVYNEVS